MAQRSALRLLVVFTVLLSGLISSTHGRKLLTDVQQKKAAPTTVEERLYMVALPKGTVPASTPSKKGHSFTVDEKLAAGRHLIAVDRILRSVPSPGMGH